MIFSSPDDNQGSRRTVTEMWKFSGAKPEFLWLARAGDEWVGRYTKERSDLDAHVTAWIHTYMKENNYRADEEGRIDYTTFIRMVCGRAADHRTGK